MSDQNYGEDDHEDGQQTPNKKRRRKPSPAAMVPGETSGGERSGAKQHSALDPDDCLTALGQLPGLVAMGLLTTAQANSMRGVYSTILQHHRTKESRGQAQLADVDVMALLRDDPSMLNVLEPMLTDAQIALIMEDPDGAEDGQA